MSTELRFHVRHIRAARLCMGGGRLYFEEQGWDWNDFLDHGRPVADIAALGDPHALKVIAEVEKEQSDGVRRG